MNLCKWKYVLWLTFVLNSMTGLQAQEKNISVGLEPVIQVGSSWYRYNFTYVNSNVISGDRSGYANGMNYSFGLNAWIAIKRLQLSAGFEYQKMEKSIFSSKRATPLYSSFFGAYHNVSITGGYRFQYDERIEIIPALQIGTSLHEGKHDNYTFSKSFFASVECSARRYISKSFYVSFRKAFRYSSFHHLIKQAGSYSPPDGEAYYDVKAKNKFFSSYTSIGFGCRL